MDCPTSGTRQFQKHYRATCESASEDSSAASHTHRTPRPLSVPSIQGDSDGWYTEGDTIPQSKHACFSSPSSSSSDLSSGVDEFLCCHGLARYPDPFSAPSLDAAMQNDRHLHALADDNCVHLSSFPLDSDAPHPGPRSSSHPSPVSRTRLIVPDRV